MLQSGLKPVNAEVALLRRSLVRAVGLPGSLRARRNTVHAVDAAVIVNHYQAVLAALVGRLGRTNLHTGRIAAVIALARHRDHSLAAGRAAEERQPVQRLTSKTIP